MCPECGRLYWRGAMSAECNSGFLLGSRTPPDELTASVLMQSPGVSVVFSLSAVSASVFRSKKMRTQSAPGAFP